MGHGGAAVLPMADGEAALRDPSAVWVGLDEQLVTTVSTRTVAIGAPCHRESNPPTPQTITVFISNARDFPETRSASRCAPARFRGTPAGPPERQHAPTVAIRVARQRKRAHRPAAYCGRGAKRRRYLGHHYERRFDRVVRGHRAGAGSAKARPAGRGSVRGDFLPRRRRYRRRRPRR